MTLRAFIFMALAICCLFQASIAASDRPNIVLIMADDLGVEGIGCYGGTSYRTPAIDQLCKQGIQFNHAYSQPLCTNTRLQLMTGLYNNRNWLYFGILDPKAKTIGHYLKEAGYSTCMAGKWQLQSYDPPSYPGSYLRRGKGMKVSEAGFDEYSLFHAWHTEDKGSRFSNPTFFENGKLVERLQGKYGPDHWVDFINDFISRKSDDENPFFVYYAMALPHRPFVPTPDSPNWNDAASRKTEDKRHFPYMVEYMDKCVGKVVKHIDELGIGKETIVIFYSDNGTHQKITSQTTTGPVVGGKGRTTDAGTHVPLIVRCPNKFKPGTNNNLVDSTDFLPTLMDMADRPIPDDTNLDGISFFSQLTGQASRIRPWVFCHYDPRPGWDKDQFRKIRFARDQRFKLYGNGQLFDVGKDKLEQNPIPAVDDSNDSLAARTRLAKVLNDMPNPDPLPRDGNPGDMEQRLYLAAGNHLSVYGINKKTGELSLLQKLPLAGAGPFTFAPNRKLMYAVATREDNQRKKSHAIATLEIDESGNLKLINTANVNNRPGYLMTDNNGEFLAGNHYGPGKATIWKLDPVYRGKEIQQLTLEQKAHSAVFSPDNHWLLVPATGPNKVFINHFTAQVGSSEPNDPPFAKGPDGKLDARQPRHLIFHPNLSIVFTTNEREMPGVGVWQWDTEKGTLNPIQNIVTQPTGFDGSITTADLHLTPDARFLYISNRDTTDRKSIAGEDSLVGFRVDPQTGRLSKIGHFPCERIPRSFTIGKQGKFVFVAGQGDSRLGVYRVQKSGTLTRLKQYKTGMNPIWIETLLIPKTDTIKNN